MQSVINIFSKRNRFLQNISRNKPLSVFQREHPYQNFALGFSGQAGLHSACNCTIWRIHFLSNLLRGRTIFIDSPNPPRMSSYLRDHLPWVNIIGLSTSVAVGIGIGIMIHTNSQNISSQLIALRLAVVELRREVNELRDKMKLQKSRSRSSFYSVNPSSGEDEDLFEEAIGYTSDNEYDLVASLNREGSSTSLFYSDDESSPIADATTFFSHLDKLLEGSDQEKENGYQMMVKKENLFSKNAEFKWRFAKSTFLMSQIEGARGKPDIEKAMCFKSRDIAFEALDINPNSCDVQKWCAITVGNLTAHVPPNDKIANGFKFKEHIEKAIELNPNDPVAHYLLGRWCYGVYQMSWIERKIAATLFANPPSATIDEALDHFLEADSLDPGKWKENLLYIAKCYIDKQNYSQGNHWIQKAKRLPVNDQDDRIAEEELNSLITKYEGYF